MIFISIKGLKAGHLYTGTYMNMISSGRDDNFVFFKNNNLLSLWKIDFFNYHIWESLTVKYRKACQQLNLA